MNRCAIGIVGGMGPHAGLELMRQIIDQTRAHRDQEHLDIILWSRPAQIPDRSEYLLGESDINPSIAISAAIRDLSSIGAKWIGIPCNTSHSRPIWESICKSTRELPHAVELISMIDCTLNAIKRETRPGRAIGVLCTAGSAKSDVYGEAIRAHGYSVHYLDDDIKLKEVHAAIYDKSRGIKATLPDVSDWSRDCLRSAALRLIEDGVEQIILGCTEIPFAIGSMTFQVPTINPSEALAATLIQRATHDG